MTQRNKKHIVDANTELANIVGVAGSQLSALEQFEKGKKEFEELERRVKEHDKNLGRLQIELFLGHGTMRRTFMQKHGRISAASNFDLNPTLETIEVIYTHASPISGYLNTPSNMFPILQPEVSVLQQVPSLFF